MNVYKLLNEKAQQYPSKPAIIFQEKSISFKELLSQVNDLAAVLQKQGIKKGEKVAIYLPNYPEYIYSYLALFSLGTVVVPLDFMLTEHEIINFINHSDTSVVIAKSKKGVDFQNVRQSCGQLSKILVTEDEKDLDQKGFIYWNSSQAEDCPLTLPADLSDQDEAAIFYTSGSTGHPKGVLLNYGHLDNPVRCIEEFLHPQADDSYLCAGVPFSHIGGLDYMLFMLNYASTLILMERFLPLETLKNLEKYKASIFCIVPSMYVAIVSLKDSQKFDLTSLKYAVVFGAPSSPALLQRFHTLCPNACLLNGWGMTETAAPNTYSPPDVDKLSSIGNFGSDMQAKIVNEEGQEVSPGENGELLVKGKGVMVGYYKEPELTREVITEDGWLRTGDIARCDEEGLFYLVGRIKEMIKVAGEIVFAPEVEAVLLRHSKVKEAAVIGIPDQLRGEKPKAYIVCQAGEDITYEEVRSFCRDKLAHFKLPHEIELRENLPKNRMGKIEKETLKREVQSAIG